MEAQNLDLNERPTEGIVQYVMLLKDKKTICRTKCQNLPFKAPDHWTISEFKPRSMYLELDLPQCQLYPCGETDHQQIEWSNFIYFLWKNKKVAVAELGSFNFYLLAPDEGPEFTHVIVLYKMRAPLLSDDGEIGSSSEIHDVPRTSSQIQKSSKTRQCWRADRSFTSRNNDLNVKNFVRTDPSYLRTLSQAHAGWIFGAIAELIDNSKDANSSRLGISVECLYSKQAGEKIPVLSVVDDGQGMSHSDIVRMVSFGHKQTDEADTSRIGRFGIGFKTGSMKLGRDVLVLTQTLSSRSVAFLSQAYNKNKENLEFPIITYRKQGTFMEVDLDIQSESSANLNLNAIRKFSPFNEYLIGERLGLFGEMRTGTQVYIWNLDKWGSAYCLEWVDGGKTVEGSVRRSQGDIFIRSRRVRSRPGQITQKVPLDYSLQAYLEVVFLNPRMKIYVQGSLVKSRPLAKSLNKTVVLKGTIMGKSTELILGRSRVEWNRMNCGIFLYWHGRLVEAYKRVGGMIHNADMGRGVIGVIDVSTLMDEGNGHVWVLSNKQGFQDCEIYAELEQWLGSKVDDYWDEHFDRVDLEMGDEEYKPDHEWVQCNKCRKWRILSSGFDSDSLPSEWFCYMPPFSRKCDVPEQPLERGVITVDAKRSHPDVEQSRDRKERMLPQAKDVSKVKSGRSKQSASCAQRKVQHCYDGDSEEDSIEINEDKCKPEFKRFRKIC
ncbi:MORC family CW-type zinc finger protein 2B-like isoform X1 [Iris pallida]|uniref:MORC family CW-type zinc finger protein 2B-like isoform X1 n=1 Tax=Iris pallida TaxID=29817 RepID=A0AAX6E7I5_IRIPA|nr:MORC family CW-type zinc finger protein 2B-like isoform X1 [Iris pallida]